jgi:hypothetical protein
MSGPRLGHHCDGLREVFGVFIDDDSDPISGGEQHDQSMG